MTKWRAYNECIDQLTPMLFDMVSAEVDQLCNHWYRTTCGFVVTTNDNEDKKLNTLYRLLIWLMIFNWQ
jgi:hypothetical protein